MGHTVSSQRQVIDRLTDELAAFGAALREEDREHFEDMLAMPMHYVSAFSNASSLHTWALFLMCICIEQQKRIEELERG